MTRWLCMLILFLAPAAACAAKRAPLLVVTDGPAGAMPPGIPERLAGWTLEACAPSAVTAEKLASHRAVLWACGDNRRPLWPSSVKALLAGFLAQGGSLMITGDHAGEALAGPTHGDLVRRWARSRWRGRVAARIVGGGTDPAAWAGTVAVPGYGADAYDPPSGAPAWVTLLDGAEPVAVRVGSRGWPEYRLALVGLDLGRVPATHAKPLVDRLMRWLLYPAREDFERLVRMARQGQDIAGAKRRARVALDCEPGALLDFIEVMREAGLSPAESP